MQDGGSPNLTDTANVDVNRVSGPTITGGSSSEILLGSNGADTLIGGGGNDVLIGNGGADHFRFNATSEGMDHIIDFNSAEGDVIDIRGSGFGGLATGTLSSSLFTANAGGNLTTSAQRFAFDTTTHTLYYDADGSGAGAKIALAHLENGANLANTDIHIV